jgi:hypothetical protein
MQSLPIQEFKSLPFRGVLGNEAGDYVLWESPRLTTMYPMAGRPPGSDRAVCHTVNGFLQAVVNNKAIIAEPTGIRVVAGLYGEYANLSGVIAFTEYQLTSNEALTYQANGALGFSAWSSFSNLAQNIYIRFILSRTDRRAEPAPLPIDLSFTGALIGSDLRF